MVNNATYNNGALTFHYFDPQSSTSSLYDTAGNAVLSNGSGSVITSGNNIAGVLTLSSL